MSQSYRKTPKHGRTTSPSEKADKTRLHRHERHAVKIKLTKTLDPDGAKIEHLRSGTWTFSKDGKIWMKCASRREMRK